MRWGVAGLCERPSVVHESDLIYGRQLRDTISQGRCVRGTVRYPGIGSAAGIEQRCRALHGCCTGQDDGCRCVPGRLNCQRQMPPAFRCTLEAVRIFSKLRGYQPRLPSGGLDAHQRHARLACEIVLDVENRFTRNGLNLAPQVAIHRIAECVLAHVFAHAVSEGVGTYIRLEHGDDCRALVIGNTVEGLSRLLGAHDWLQYGMGRDSSIRTLAALVDARGLQTGVPLRMQCVRGVRLHPPGETLVEPQIVPPCHGDEVPEPLVGHLVADDEKDSLPLALGGCCRIKKKIVLRIEDGAPVFHGAAGYLPGSGNQVELGQRKAHAKIAVVVVKQGDCLLECIGGLARVSALEHHAHVDAVYLPVDALKISDTQKQKIGRHPGCLGEAHEPQAAFHRGDGCDRHVRYGHLVGGGRHGDGENGLESRFIPARQQSARIGRLEVGGQRAALTGWSVVVHRKETDGSLGNRPVIRDRQRVRPGREWGRKSDRRPAQLIVQRDRAARLIIQAHLVERESLGVHHHLSATGRCVAGDLHYPLERQRLCIGDQAQLVASRHERAGQHLTAFG